MRVMCKPGSVGDLGGQPPRSTRPEDPDPEDPRTPRTPETPRTPRGLRLALPRCRATVPRLAVPSKNVIEPMGVPPTRARFLTVAVKLTNEASPQTDEM